MRPPATPRRPAVRSATPQSAVKPAKKTAKKRAKKEPAARKPAASKPAAKQGLARRASRSKPMARARDAQPSARAGLSATARVSQAFRARLAERHDAGRRLAWRRSAIVIGVLAALLAVAWVLLASSFLALDRESVQITGASEYVPAESVEAALAPHVGTPLLRVDTGEIAEQIQDLDAVADVAVTRSWPDGLAVTLVSRTPVAATEDGARWVLIDADGIQVATRSEAPEDLPEVDVPLDEAGRTSAAVEAVLTVLGELPESLLEQVGEAGATGTAQVTLELSNGATVRWGSAVENSYKAAVLEVLLEERSASYYDVSVPSSPATRP
ncbi:cell division protein FtsQ/DivIB [Bogoriella caseilytica]|uniref:Cell division septal protein FtsQ n=1 Tax=Bogoriella caseilytica TaxID=56055 RepID=A0A3N2B9A3_9MICO|nr:FtsQ-type POTRA domain-containing protein [Bogoriella caseilytica]ROR71837.1 cell division septal protein FtsQ [Bogoriella caseilytica]